MREVKKDKMYYDIENLNEKFIFLCSGLFGNGDLGHDRKNIGLTIKLFFETFKNTPNPPALLLKTSLGNSSYMNRDQILHRIKKIRKSIKADTLPNVYLLNGDITDEQMNNLYNHPRIKAMLSFHKGEGWGRGLFEFTLVNKPLIASGWSGSNDFLDPSLAILLPGKLENVHHSAANKWLIPESQWFQINPETAMGAMREVYNNYKKYKTRAITQGYKNRTSFSYNKMKELVAQNIEQNFPKFPVTEQIKMPTIKQIK